MTSSRRNRRWLPALQQGISPLSPRSATCWRDAPRISEASVVVRTGFCIGSILPAKRYIHHGGSAPTAGFSAVCGAFSIWSFLEQEAATLPTDHKRTTFGQSMLVAGGHCRSSNLTTE